MTIEKTSHAEYTARQWKGLNLYEVKDITPLEALTACVAQVSCSHVFNAVPAHRYKKCVKCSFIKKDF